MKRFLFGTLAVLATLVGAIWLEGGDLVALLLPSPFLISFCVPVFAVLAVWDLRAWGRAWRDAFAPAPEAKSRENSARLWEFFEKISYAAGFMGFVAGAIIILGHEDSYVSMAQPFSVALISPLYAAFLAIVARILRNRVAAGL
jgi:flagellar motor component MotA